MTPPIFRIQVDGPEGAREVTCRLPDLLWIGRDDGAHIALRAKNVSRRHVSVAWTPTGLNVSDASSSGTIVNGIPLMRSSRLVEESPVVLQVGAFRLHLTATEFSELEPVRSERELVSVAPTAEFRRRINRQLVEHLDLSRLGRGQTAATELRPQVIAALRRIVASSCNEGMNRQAQETLVQELTDEALGLGPLERLLNDPDVTEIMVVDPHTIFVERAGKMVLTGSEFTDDDSVRAVIERIVTPLGRRIDESTPLVDARLMDGSRVNAIIPPLALRGPCITIRKFAKEPLLMKDLIAFGSLTTEMARFLERSVAVRKNIVVSGGTGSGKTTLLNVLSAAIPAHERIVTVEDAAELRFTQPHVVSLEARPANLEGKGEYSIRDLVKNALRMRPDRIVVGECRGGEALDMLQAMNTGHEGSLTTTHANTPRDAVARIETLCLTAGLDLPVSAIRQQVAASVHLIVQQSRLSDGSRRITSISEVTGLSSDGEVELREIFGFTIKQTRRDGTVDGDFVATGYLPSFLDQFIAHGLVREGTVL